MLSLVCMATSSISQSSILILYSIFCLFGFIFKSNFIQMYCVTIYHLIYMEPLCNYIDNFSSCDDQYFPILNYFHSGDSQIMLLVVSLKSWKSSISKLCSTTLICILVFLLSGKGPSQPAPKFIGNIIAFFLNLVKNFFAKKSLLCK